jgi:hypothetical protein
MIIYQWESIPAHHADEVVDPDPYLDPDSIRVEWLSWIRFRIQGQK